MLYHSPNGGNLAKPVSKQCKVNDHIVLYVSKDIFRER